MVMSWGTAADGALPPPLPPPRARHAPVPGACRCSGARGRPGAARGRALPRGKCEAREGGGRRLAVGACANAECRRRPRQRRAPAASGGRRAPRARPNNGLPGRAAGASPRLSPPLLVRVRCCSFAFRLCSAPPTAFPLRGSPRSASAEGCGECGFGPGSGKQAQRARQWRAGRPQLPAPNRRKQSRGRPGEAHRAGACRRACLAWRPRQRPPQEEAALDENDRDRASSEPLRAKIRGGGPSRRGRRTLRAPAKGDATEEMAPKKLSAAERDGGPGVTRVSSGSSLSSAAMAQNGPPASQPGGLKPGWKVSAFASSYFGPLPSQGFEPQHPPLLPRPAAAAVLARLSVGG